jgi:hypothetical protein
MWGKVLFAMLMLVGMFVSFANKNYMSAIFFAIVTCFMIWLIKTRPKAEVRP